MPSPITPTDAEATYEDVAAPSREDLLKRAAERSNARMTWESIVLAPTDPILGQKMQPRVRQRRARLRLVVKAALGACVAFCLFVFAGKAFSLDVADETSSSAPRKTAPAVGTVPVEKLDAVTRGRAGAASHLTAAARPAPSPKTTWGAKRH
jgi:hypothetical protein